MAMLKFRIGGQDIELDHATVLARLKDKRPGTPDRRNKHFVMVGRRRWPVKLALAEAAGIDLLTFPTGEAVRAMTKLGFPVQRATVNEAGEVTFL